MSSRSVITCPECDSDQLTWSVAKHNLSGVVDGRLGVHDITVYLLLGCEECSATVRLIDADSSQGLDLLSRIGGFNIDAPARRRITSTEPL
jgi:hypothetical protein